jgi:hypothetical protein
MEIVRNYDRDFEISNGRLTFTAKNGIFSFVGEAGGTIGWKNFYFETLYGKDKTVKTQSIGGAVRTASTRIKDAIGKGVEAVFAYDNVALQDVIHVKAYEGFPFITIRHDVVNLRTEEIGIVRTADIVISRQGGVTAGPQGFLIHSENISRYTLFSDYEDSDEFVMEFPSLDVTFGNNENFPFPALFIGSRETGAGLVDAVLTQDRRYRTVQLRGSADELQNYRGELRQRGVAAIPLAPKKTLLGETLYLEIADEVTDCNAVFRNYLDCLIRRGGFRGRKSPSVHQVIWGSWNEGIYRTVTEEIVLRNARFIKEKFPTVKWVQIDDGYFREEFGSGCGHGYPDLDANVDKKKFPHGMKYLAEQIKEAGLRPAIWVGLFIEGRCPIVAEHSEWFLRDANTGAILTLSTGEDPTDPSRPLHSYHMLDFSVKEAREYITGVFKTLIKEWGFEGIKLDFWSHTFETGRARLADEKKTLLEWRKWLLEMVRSMLPADGYLEVACSVGQGNPFLGFYVDNFRTGIDIGNGNWDNIKRTAQWFMPDALHVTNRIYVGNSDSVSIMSGLTEVEKYSWFNYCLVTRTMCELAGDLEKVGDMSKIEELQKILKVPFNGEKVFMADFSLDNRHVPPHIWYFEGSAHAIERPARDGAVRFVVVINWEDDEREFQVTAGMLRLDPDRRYVIRDYWTNEEGELSGAVRITLGAHASKAFHVFS